MHLWNEQSKALPLCPHIMIFLFVNYFIHSSIPIIVHLLETQWRHVDHRHWRNMRENTTGWKNICIISRFIRTNTCYLTDLNIISCICRFRIKIYKYIKFSIFLEKCNQYAFTFIYIKYLNKKCITNHSWETSAINIASLNAVKIINIYW